MNNPICVEVTRGNKVESVHRGAISVVDGDGRTVLEIGDVLTPIFPRSAIKSIQALPLVESGAAEKFGFKDAELSLSCASHSGEAEHVRLARDMLSRAGLSEDVLECGGHWSSHQKVLLQQSKIYDSTPPAICNNCSGKHTGFVCTAAHTGLNPNGYVGKEHQIQRTVRDTLQDVLGFISNEDECGTDGCSIPTYAVPLRNLAHGFAKMATGNGLQPQRAKAARSLLNACMAQPFYMAGTKRFCTDIMILGKGRIFAKTGAEGVFCGALPELGLGIALKCDDGAARGAETIMARVVSHLLKQDDPLQEGLSKMATKQLKNWNRIPVGELRAHIPLDS